MMDVYKNFMNPKKNGKDCPKCGEELWDTRPYLQLNSNPPKKEVHCEKCNYKGYRIASTTHL